MTDVYRLTPPSGKPFLARITYAPNAIVETTRETGEWKADPALALPDLIMPEQGRLYDWDVVVGVQP